jgi:predicted phosphoribosyltransferase
MMKYLFDILNINIEEITKFLKNPYSLFIISYINAPLNDEFEIVGIESEHDFIDFIL